MKHKRTERLYREGGLKVRRRKRKWVAAERRPFAMPSEACECRAIDFTSDALSTERRYRIFNVVNVCTRECLVWESNRSLPAARVIDPFDEVAIDRGYPRRIACDNGPEFRSRAFEAWAYEHGVVVGFTQSGKPARNAFGENFDGKMRNERLHAHWWRTIAEARQGDEEVRTIHNTFRPHRPLGKMTQAEFAAADGSNLPKQAVGS